MMKSKFVALVENLYFSINLISSSERWTSYFEKKILEKIDKKRLESLQAETFIKDEIEVINGIKRYPYGFKIRDKLRVYIAYKTGSNYPIYVIVSAMFMHTNTIADILKYIENKVIEIIKYFDDEFVNEIYEMKLSRIDICNHNNVIVPQKYIKVEEYNSKVVTKIKKVFPVIERIGENDINIPYYRFGKGDAVVRFYNKTQEVIEQRYKSFFIKRWLDIGLITEREFKIYEYIYKLNNNYLVDYLYTNLIFSENIIDDKKEYLKNVYYDIKLENNDKYDIFKKYVKEYKVKLVKEISNVEFQLRNTFLKTVKLININTGEYIDFTNVYELIKHIDILYKYITDKVFRVIDKNDNKKRKRNKKTDKIWIKVQNSKIYNVNKLDINDVEVLRKYQNEMNKFNSVKDTIQKLVHNYYLSQNKIDYENIKDVELYDLLDLISSEYNDYNMNESYYSIYEKLKKQIKYYGKKNNPKNRAKS